jgi:hypothetical protein
MRATPLFLQPFIARHAHSRFISIFASSASS